MILQLVDARHTDVLNHVEVGQVLLSKGHPEAGQLDGGVILHQTLQLLMVHQVALAGTDVGIGDGLVNLQRLGLKPFPILIVESLLRNLADIDFGVEVGGKGLVVIAGVAVHDVQLVHLVEVMLGCIGGIDSAYTRIEAAAQNGRQSSLFKALLVGPLPAVLKVRLILGLVVGRIKVVHTSLETGLHDGEILIRQGHIDDDVWTEAVEEGHQLIHAVGIYLCRLNSGVAYGFHDGITFGLGAASNHDFVEHILILSHFVCYDSTYTASTDNKNFTHFLSLNLFGLTLSFCDMRILLAANIRLFSE